MSAVAVKTTFTITLDKSEAIALRCALGELLDDNALSSALYDLHQELEDELG